jgi:WD40 repeat protein
MRLVFIRALPLLLIAARVYAEPVSFREQIAPILQRRCANCHNEESNKGHYRLDSFALLQKSGDSELPPVVAGKSQESELYRLLLEKSPEDRMPQKADPLPDDEITLIKRWLDDGAVYDGGPPERPLAEIARESLLRPAPERYLRPVPVTAVAFGPGGEFLATAGYYELLIWNLETGDLVRRVGGMPEKMTSIAWHPKKNVIAVGGGSPGQWGTVAIIDPANEYRVRILADFADTTLSVAINPAGDILAVGGSDRAVRILDIASGKQTKLLRVHADWVQSVSFSRDGTRLLSVGRDRTGKVLGTAKWEVEATYTEHQTGVLAGTFMNQDGSRVLSVDRSKVLHEWDGRNGNKRDTHPALPGEPVQILFRDGLVYAAGGSPVITIDQLSDDQRLFKLRGHRDAVQAIALSPNSYEIATGSADGEVILWDIYSGTWTHRFTASPMAAPQPQVTSTQ